MKATVAMILLVGSGTVALAAPFQNLGFDAANTNNLVTGEVRDFGYGTVEDMLPGWQLVREPIPFQFRDIVWFNLPPYEGRVALLDRNNRYDPGSASSLPVEGRFSFAMGPWVMNGPNFDRLYIGVVQMGDIPADTKSLRFSGFGDQAEVFINGTQIDVTYDYYEEFPPGDPDLRRANAFADISAYAGQTVELKFQTVDFHGPGLGTLIGLDSIIFSPIPIPEPSAYAVFVLGCAVLGRCWRLCRR
jgi:hypothetical protein